MVNLSKLGGKVAKKLTAATNHMGKKFLFRRVFYAEGVKTAEELKFIVEYLDTETEIKHEFFWQAFNEEQKQELCQKLKFHRVERGHVKKLPVVNKTNPTLFILMSGHGKVLLTPDPNANPKAPPPPQAKSPKASATKTDEAEEVGAAKWGMLKGMYVKSKDEVEDDDGPKDFNADEHHMIKAGATWGDLELPEEELELLLWEYENYSSDSETDESGYTNGIARKKGKYNAPDMLPAAIKIQQMFRARAAKQKFALVLYKYKVHLRELELEAQQAKERKTEAKDAGGHGGHEHDHHHRHKLIRDSKRAAAEPRLDMVSLQHRNAQKTQKLKKAGLDEADYNDVKHPMNSSKSISKWKYKASDFDNNSALEQMVQKRQRREHLARKQKYKTVLLQSGAEYLTVASCDLIHCMQRAAEGARRRRLLIEMGLESLIHFMQPQKLAPGVLIVSENDPGADVFVVAQGECRLLKEDPAARGAGAGKSATKPAGQQDSSAGVADVSAGSEFVFEGDGGTYACKKSRQRQVGHLGTKGIVGDMALLLGVPQPTTCVTTCSVEVLRFSAADFMHHVPQKVQRQLLQTAVLRHQWAEARAQGNFDRRVLLAAGSDAASSRKEPPLVSPSRRTSARWQAKELAKHTNTKLGARAKPITALLHEPLHASLEERATATSVGSILFAKEGKGKGKGGHQADKKAKSQGRAQQGSSAALKMKSKTKAPRSGTVDIDELPVETICRNGAYHCNGMAAAMFPPLANSRSLPARLSNSYDGGNSIKSASSSIKLARKDMDASLAGRKPLVIRHSKGFSDTLNRRVVDSPKHRSKIPMSLDSTRTMRPIHLTHITAARPFSPGGVQ